MDAVSLLTYLNKIGGEHACGLLDIVENRLVGLKSRGVYETPGGSLLYKAHECLEQLVLDKETLFENKNSLWFMLTLFTMVNGLLLYVKL